jgi:hypothetical protein
VVRELLVRLTQPEDRIILALLAIVVAYAIWGAILGWKRERR